MQLEMDVAGRFPVVTHMTYDAGDPFAVTLEFSHEGRVLARWRLDRQMLADGMERPVGEGDVHMRPQSDGTWEEVRMQFFGEPEPDGHRHTAVIVAWSPAVASFLDETYEAVRPGHEEVCLDGFLAEVIAGG
ncbi:SsgA family sporulation/cell division regulator [Streptomyces sp. NPDC059785]|uniref:SsgA family sporulation/cell division regulator n=1 Tax=unclassified Streptomyces TaxID=2593676 RepID=UPI003650A928